MTNNNNKSSANGQNLVGRVIELNPLTYDHTDAQIDALLNRLSKKDAK